MKHHSILCILFGLALALSACGKKDEGGDKKSDTAGDKKAGDKKAGDKKAGDKKAATKSPADEAKQMFNTMCATCHGKSGKGDGMAAKDLPAKPRDYTDKEWQAKATDENLAKAIIEGGPAVGLNAAMPPNPPLKDKPEVVAELVKIIRAFGK
jgi:cytochrome c553